MGRLFSDRFVLDLVEHIYAAGCDPAEWPAFVAKVQAAVPDTAVHGLLDIHGTQIAYNSASAGIADDLIESYLAYYHRINPYNRIFSGLTPGRIYSSGELGPPGWLDRVEFYNDWLRPAGNFKRGVGVVVAREPERQFRFTIDLPEKSAEMEPQCGVLLGRIAPHMTRAFDVNKRLQAAAVTSQALGGLLDRVEGAAVLLDGAGRVITMNEAAEALVRRRSLVTVGADRRLGFRQPAYDAGYRRALAAALEVSFPDAPHAFRVADASLPSGTVLVLPLRPKSQGIVHAGAQPRAIVVMRAATSAATAPKELLQALYGLTPAESEAVLEIASGTNPKDAADRLGITQTTVRNQLAAAMTKMGVHRQAELVAAVSRLAPRFKLNGES